MKNLYRLIDEGEHQQQDFKYRVDDARKIGRTLAAFANTDGGRLLIGVKDNGRISGVRSEEELHVIETAALLYTKPEVAFEPRLWELEGKTVLEVWVPPSAHKPHMARNDRDEWRPYLRQDDQNLVANRVLTKVWKMGKSRKGANIRFTETEELLFRYLRENGGISMSKFCRISELPHPSAVDLLAKLVSWDVIGMDLTEKGCTYRLKSHLEDE